MRIRQYVYFAVWSTTLSAAEITAQLGVEPTDFTVRGSRIAEPPHPRSHSWRVKCEESGLRIEEQIAQVVNRLQPYRDQLSALAAELFQHDPPGGMTLQVVRYYDDEGGEEENERETTLPDGRVFERLPGQHQLFGWHVDSATQGFLLAVGAEIDVDEYG